VSVRRTSWVLVVSAVLLVGPSIDDALAKKPKSRVRGTIQPVAANAGELPVSVEDGSFSVVLFDVGV